MPELDAAHNPERISLRPEVQWQSTWDGDCRGWDWSDSPVRVWCPCPWSMTVRLGWMTPADAQLLGVWSFPSFHLVVLRSTSHSTSGSEQCDPIVSLHLVRIRKICGVDDEHWSTARDVSRASAMDEPITAWNSSAGRHPMVLDRSGESWSTLSQWFCCSIGRLWRIAALLAQVVLGRMPLPLAMKVLPEILLFPIVLIICLTISLILLWTSATFTSFTAITNTFPPIFVKSRASEESPFSPLNAASISMGLVTISSGVAVIVVYLLSSAPGRLSTRHSLGSHEAGRRCVPPL